MCSPLENCLPMHCGLIPVPEEGPAHMDQSLLLLNFDFVDFENTMRHIRRDCLSKIQQVSKNIAWQRTA